MEKVKKHVKEWIIRGKKRPCNDECQVQRYHINIIWLAANIARPCNIEACNIYRLFHGLDLYFPDIFT